MSKTGTLNNGTNLAYNHDVPTKQRLSVILGSENRSAAAIKFRSPTPTPLVPVGDEAGAFSHSINQQLHAYAVGNKLRRLRLKKGMALVTLGKLSGLSSSMLCKLERGRALPTLPTLLRVSHALGVELEYFFHDSHQPSASIVRRNERLRFRNVPNSAYTYAFESLNFRARNKQFNAFWAEFQPLTEKPQSHQHAGVEFLYVLEGEMAVRVGPEEHRLESGDAIYFESEVPHSYRRLGSVPCRALVVVSPTPDDADLRIDSGHNEYR